MAIKRTVISLKLSDLLHLRMFMNVLFTMENSKEVKQTPIVLKRLIKTDYVNIDPYTEMEYSINKVNSTYVIIDGKAVSVECLIDDPEYRNIYKDINFFITDNPSDMDTNDFLEVLNLLKSCKLLPEED